MQINPVAALMLLIPAAAFAAPPDRLILTRTQEPKEGAFSVLVPKGWQVRGGIFRVDPNQAGGPGNAVSAKLDFTIQKDASGGTMIHWLPEWLYIDTRNLPVAGLFPPGSNYNGMRVSPRPTALDFLARVVLPQVSRQAANVQVVERKQLSEFARSYTQRVRAYMPPPLNFTYDTAVIGVTFTENGVRYKARMLALVEDWGPIGQGMWANKETLYFRAPEAEFPLLERVLSSVQNSLKLNHQWLMGEMRGQMERTRIVEDTQRYIAKIDREIVAHRQRTNAEIHKDMFLTLTGQEEYVNPYTKEVEVDNSDWKYRWVNPGGDIVVSNNQNYDPNQDADLRRSDFKRTPVRPR